VNSNTLTADYLIIGSGAAGLNAALQASRYGEVILITKSSLEASSSYWAQGGIAAVLNSNDSFESHKKDTLEAGRGLCDPKAVDVLVEEGADRVRELIDLGMPFDFTNGSLDLSLEGGHSNRRVLHANGAATGKVLIDFLTDQVKKHENITIIEHAFVFKLLMREGSCIGASAYLYEEERLLSVQSQVTVLATGGYSGLYQRSTNPHTSTGDGLWLGYYAGTELQDLELVQFHPTAFYAEDGSTFLISEAVRGEGARLYNVNGERFMNGYPQKELSPRDVVSQEIFEQIQHQSSNYVYLDVRHLNTNKLRNHFPNLFEKIEASGVDIEIEGIPVAPAAHYCIGGIATHLNGQTSVDGLYACGEVAATGVHGANRLASNSLLECLVFSKRAVDHAVRNHKEYNSEVVETFFEIDEDTDSFTRLQLEVSELLSRFVGIRRDRTGLEEALQKICNLQDGLYPDENEYYGLRSQGMLKVAELITKSALQRRESRGVHTRSDFPELGSKTGHIKFGTENQPHLTVEW
jgi:L-aspartate oxidase